MSRKYKSKCINWIKLTDITVLSLTQLASLVAQMVRQLCEIQEPWVQSLGQEDALEKGMATHSSIPVWRIPWTEEPGRLQFIGLQRLKYDWANNTFTFHNTFISNKISCKGILSNVLIASAICEPWTSRCSSWF